MSESLAIQNMLIFATLSYVELFQWVAGAFVVFGFAMVFLLAIDGITDSQ